MATMTRAQFQRSLEEGINTHFGLAYKDYPEEYTEIFDVESSEKAYEEDVQMIGLGLAVQTGEGAQIQMDSGQEGWTKRYLAIKFALGFPVTKEAIDDNLYGSLSAKYSKELASSMRQSKEIYHANILNRAFNSSYVGGDSVELCGSHTLYNGATLQNELATPADLAEEGLEDLCIAIWANVDDRGKKKTLMPRKLVVPPALAFAAERLTMTTARPGTALNDVNAHRSMGMLPDGYCVNHYLTSATKWWIKTDARDGMKHIRRTSLEQNMDYDKRTQTYIYMASERYSAGWTDFRAMWGSDN